MFVKASLPSIYVSCSRRTYSCPCNQTEREDTSTSIKEVDQYEVKIIPLTSEDSDSDCEREEDNPSQTKSEEISSLSFDSSPKESSTVYGFFQNLVGKFQNTDPSSYIEQAIE